MQENVLLGDDSDSVLYATNIRQGCKDELCKYKGYVPRVPIRNRFPDPQLPGGRSMVNIFHV